MERKFRVVDLVAVADRLARYGAQPVGAMRQIDRYFAHPARDFAATDEALRIRQVGEENFLTYKGPKIDAVTKTRREIELPFASGTQGAEELAELLVALGFRPVAAVQKHRQAFHLEWEGRPFEAALDEVDRVGSYAELETQAEADDLDAARASLASLAARFELTEDERRSYLELLLGATAEADAR